MRTYVTHDEIVIASTRHILTIQKYFPRGEQIPFAGKLLEPAAMIAHFEESLEARALVIAKQGEYKAALAKRDALEVERRTMEDALKAWVLNRYGAGSSVAHEFGFSARRPPKMSAEGRALAALRNKATREARGTMGKKEKLKIKGTIARSPPSTPASADPSVTDPSAATSTTGPSAGDDREP